MVNITDLQAIIIPFVVTTCIFYIEALIHYHMGKYDKVGFEIPPLKENIKIVSIITGFAFLSSGITYLLEMYFSN